MNTKGRDVNFQNKTMTIRRVSEIVDSKLRSVLFALERSTTGYVQKELNILQVRLSHVVVDDANFEEYFIHTDWKCHSPTGAFVIATILP